MLTLIILFASMFIFLNHPLSLGLILFMETILISLFTGQINQNFWFSYILFLILIGGMMVLFIYMTSIASNEKFSFKLIPMFASLMSLSILIFNIKPLQNFNNQNNLHFILSMNKFFNSNLFLTFNLIIIYLLITLITVVVLTDSQQGPLRQSS